MSEQKAQHLLHPGRSTPATNDIFSELDIHFARLMTRFCGKEVPELFLAAALVSRATSEGHICLGLSSNWVQSQILDGEYQEYCLDPVVWRDKLYSTGIVGRPGDYKPLILDDRSRLYLYRYWQYEKRLADDIKGRVDAGIGEIDIPLLGEGLSRLFPQTKEGEIDWQKVACFASVLKRFCVISGGPGTGKSSIIAKILALILGQSKANKVRPALVAPTGKAAARLQESVKTWKEMLPVSDQIKDAIVPEASTIHRLLGSIPGSPYFRYNAENRLPVDIVVIDEASMVDLALMSKLVQAVPSDARLILIGDKDQLASVEAGSVLGDICDTGRTHGFSQAFSDIFHKTSGCRIHTEASSVRDANFQDSVVQLKKSYRFGANSGPGVVSRAVNNGDGNLALTIIKSSEFNDIRWNRLPTPDGLRTSIRETVIRVCKPYLKADDPAEIFRLFGQFRLLCALRKGPYGVSALNHAVEQILSEENLVNAEKRWYRGRPVLVTKNDYNLQLFNGDVGIILPDPGADHDLRAFFMSPDGTLRKFLPIRLPEHETVYAMTVHKSQGSEFDEVLLILPGRDSPVLTRELIYTGITRARESAEIWGAENVFLTAVTRRIERTSGLRDALWE